MVGSFEVVSILLLLQCLLSERSILCCRHLFWSLLLQRVNNRQLKPDKERQQWTLLFLIIRPSGKLLLLP